MLEGTIPGAGGVPVYFRKFGGSRTGLLIPNAAWLSRDFEPLVRDRTVVFFDPRGRGSSGPMVDKSQVTLEGETEDLELVRRHCELDRVVLFGWSYHGTVIANCASRHPGVVERMVMSGPLAPAYAEQAAATLQSRLDMQAIADLTKSPPVDPAAASKAWRDVLTRGYFADGGAYARSFPKPRESENERIGNVNQYLNAFMASLANWDWRSAARQYAGPVLIVHGRGDFLPLEGSQEWQASFRNARLVVVPKAGHYIWMEQPERFFEWLEGFLGDGNPDGWRWPASQ